MTWIMAVHAYGAVLTVTPSRVLQGNAFLLILDAAGAKGVPEGTFRELPVYFSKNGNCRYVGLANADRQLPPADYPVTVRLDGEAFTADVTVLSQDFPVERLTLPERQVTLSKEDTRRAQEEATALGRLWPRVSEIRWTWPFRLPVEGDFGTQFGTRRILNGTEKSPHNGTDIKAEKGSLVKAITAGTVALREELFFGGNTLVIDHGGGLYSFYMHLDSFLVTPGERVTGGQPVGTVGSSGRSTGPHLHVGAKLGGVNVNPLSLVDLKIP